MPLVLILKLSFLFIAHQSLGVPPAAFSTVGGMTNAAPLIGVSYNSEVSWALLNPASGSDQLSSSGMPGGVIDILAILKFLAGPSYGNFNTANYQITDIRLGQESSGGAGTFTVNSFSCTEN